MVKELEKRILSTVILIPLCLFLIINGSILFNIFLILCFALTSYEWHMMVKRKNYYIYGFLFLFISFYSTYSLRNNFGNDSLVFFLIIIITCVATDIGGFIFGKIFQGPRLTKISPNKTYSGMIGGYFLTGISIYAFLQNSYNFGLKSFDFNIGLIIIIFLISTISQVGDITISYFKRLSKIKDTGKIIPGHGGILDRIDGMIFAFPFSYFLFSLNLLK